MVELAFLFYTQRIRHLPHLKPIEQGQKRRPVRKSKLLEAMGGGEYINKQFQIYLEEAGIQHIISTPYSPS